LEEASSSADTLRFLLAFRSITQNALTGQANMDGKTGDELLVVENGTFVKKMDMAHATKHAMTKSSAPHEQAGE
jgi:hypothetical protein